MTLRLLEVLKEHGIKQPAGIKIDQTAGTGLKEEKNMNFDLANISESGKENELQSSEAYGEDGKGSQ